MELTTKISKHEKVHIHTQYTFYKYQQLVFGCEHCDYLLTRMTESIDICVNAGNNVSGIEWSDR